MRTLLLSAVLACFCASGTFAFDDQDRSDVEQAVADFEQAFADGDWEAVLPPDRLFEVIASLSGKRADEIKYGALAAMADTMEGVDLIYYDIRSEDMVGGVSSAGALYATMPSFIRMDIDGTGQQEVESQVFAAKLDEGWRLFRLETAQNWLLFLRAYPQFEGVAFGQ